MSRRCEVRPASVGMGVFALEPIGPGESVIELPPVFDEQPALHTIQIEERRHQAYTGDLDDFVNHSCDPNTQLDVANLRIVARRAIAPGDEVTLDYRASEWEMVEPFVCVCDGTPRAVRGFRHLSPAEQSQIAPLAPAWLRARADRLR